MGTWSLHKIKAVMSCFFLMFITYRYRWVQLLSSSCHSSTCEWQLPLACILVYRCTELLHPNDSGKLSQNHTWEQLVLHTWSLQVWDLKFKCEGHCILDRHKLYCTNTHICRLAFFHPNHQSSDTFCRHSPPSSNHGYMSSMQNLQWQSHLFSLDHIQDEKD